MDSMFSADSPLMRGLTRVADVMILNALFIVTALPIFTLGAALTALNFVAMRIATGECNSVTGDYLRSFRRNFRQATTVGLVLVIFTAVLAAWHAVITRFDLQPMVEFGLLVIWYVLAFNFLATTLFVFPYLASFETGTRALFRNARLLSWKHPLTTFVGLTVIALSLAVTVFFPVATGYGLFWFLFGFAGIAVVNGHLFSRIFSRYIAAATSDGT